MRTWFLTATAAILTLVGLASFNAPAMAREFHSRPVRIARSHPVTGWRHAAPYRANIRCAPRVRVTHPRVAHFRGARHVFRRR